MTPSWTVPEAELSERFSRSSGPGGQGVNTTDSRVELSFDVRRAGSVPEHLRGRVLARLDHRLVDGVLRIAASQHRAQRSNRQDARDRLVRLLRDAAAPPPPRRRATRPSRASHERRLAQKRRRAEVKRGRRTS